MKRFCMFFQKLPFCGKFAIKDDIYQVIFSQDWQERVWNFIRCVGLLVLFIICHFAQACAGLDLAIGMKHIAIVCIFGLAYALVNLLATFVQIYTLCRMIILVRRIAGHYACGVNKRKCYVSRREEFIAIAFTITAQIIFMMLYDRLL